MVDFRVLRDLNVLTDIPVAHFCSNDVLVRCELDVCLCCDDNVVGHAGVMIHQDWKGAFICHGGIPIYDVLLRDDGSEIAWYED